VIRIYTINRGAWISLGNCNFGIQPTGKTSLVKKEDIVQGEYGKSAPCPETSLPIQLSPDNRCLNSGCEFNSNYQRR
jgi:hypothetical protein